MSEEQKKKITLKDLLDPAIAEQYYPQLEDYFQNGGTWAALVGLNDDSLEAHYAHGFKLYNEGNLAEAETAFSTLTVLNPYVAKYWLALGATREVVESEKEAIEAYLLAAAIEQSWALPHLYLARCFLRLNRRDGSRIHLDEFERLATSLESDTARAEARTIRGRLDG